MPENTNADPGRAQGGSIALDIVLHYWPVLLAGALFVAFNASLLTEWWKGWNKPYSYYSHGPLVPLIAAFVVWSNRKRMARVKISPSWLGLLFILPLIPVFVFGRWTGSGVLCGAAFISFLLGASLLFAGTRITRVLLFPILFLIAMIPAPSTVLDNATLRVQLQSTSVAAKMLNATGYSVTQQGAEIHSQELPEPLIIGTPCSGFRLLISLLTFTAFFVYMLQAPGWKKAAIVLVSFPLSLFINALRIAMIGYAGFWTGSADAMHKFHDWSGYIGLVVCFVILFGFARLIKANVFGIPNPPDGPEAASGMPLAHKLIGRGYRGAAVIALFALVLLTNGLVRPLEVTAKGRLVRENIPITFDGWVGRDVPLDPVSKRELKSADILNRIYTNNELDGRQVIVLVMAARDTDAFHDPHSCLPGGGAPVTQDKTITFDFKRPRPIDVRASMLQSEGQYGPDIVVYWYMTGDETCARTSEVRQRMRATQLRDLYDLTFHPGTRAETRRRISNTQWYWYRFSTSVWQDTDTDLKVLKSFVREFTANLKSFGE